jgi:hypothetical protein
MSNKPKNPENKTLPGFYGTPWRARTADLLIESKKTVVVTFSQTAPYDLLQ